MTWPVSKLYHAWPIIGYPVLIAVVELHGLFMGPKMDCDKLLVSSGMLGVPGITYRYYSESDYLTAATIIAGMTEGVFPCSVHLCVRMQKMVVLLLRHICR